MRTDRPTLASPATATLTATNSSGTGPAFTLTFMVAGPMAPTITQSPASQAALLGGGAQFAVVASGPDPLTYQ